MKKIVIYGLAVLVVGLSIGAWFQPSLLYVFVIVAPLCALAVYDLLQTRHTILRNYPVAGHIRYLLEDIHTQIRQYLIESDLEGSPFAREYREMIYVRAKNVSNVHPFGTINDVYRPNYEWINHSIAALEPLKEEPRLLIGGENCTKPYSASRLNISAMSFGALSANAIEALNTGAKLGNFAHDTGEGAISRYHLKPGGDLIWELGTGYFGCRTRNGRFDPAQFRDKAGMDVVKMIEIKLSQGAKPGGGGILPAAKVSEVIAEARGVPLNQDVESPPAHSAFSSPIEMVEFIQQLREFSGGKPVGFKLCIGRKEEFFAILKAMRETEILADFIVIDGSEGGTGAAPQELSDSVGTPLRDALVFAHNALVGSGLRDRIRVGASGKIVSGFDIAAKIAMGADWCNSARGMMFALGCIQARRCHTNTCPSGVATQNPWRSKGLVVKDKGVRVFNFHHNTIAHFLRVLGAAGLTHPRELLPEMLYRRISPTQVMHYRELYHYLEPGDLLEGLAPPSYQEAWAAADPAHFH